jgi:hypothetical protein
MKRMQEGKPFALMKKQRRDGKGTNASMRVMHIEDSTF